MLNVSKHFHSLEFLICFIYFFNINAGSASLTLPRGFADVGWLLGTVTLILVALISYITIQFIIESLSIANAVSKVKALETVNFQRRCSKTSDTTITEIIPIDCEASKRLLSSSTLLPNGFSTYGLEKVIDHDLNNVYEITENHDLIAMTYMFAGRYCFTIAYIVITLFCYGSLSVSVSIFGHTLSGLTCSRLEANCSTLANDLDLCWESYPRLTRFDVYRTYIVIFLGVVTPLVFIDLHQVKLMQLLTFAYRIFAYSSLIIISTIMITTEHSEAKTVQTANWSALPRFIGTAIFSLVNHYAVPGIVCLATDKRKILRNLFLTLMALTIIYILLSLSAVFAFSYIEPIFTLNFSSRQCLFKTNPIISRIGPLALILPIWPVITICTNLPMKAISLRNNLQSFGRSLFTESLLGHRMFKLMQKVVIPLFAIVPPFIFALLCSDVSAMVSNLGNIMGIFMQGIIPIIVIIKSRQCLRNVLKTISPSCQFLLLSNKCKYSGRLTSNGVVSLVIIWSLISMALTTTIFFK